jgi:hypothetical protein
LFLHVKVKGGQPHGAPHARELHTMLAVQSGRGQSLKTFLMT